MIHKMIACSEECLRLACCDFCRYVIQDYFFNEDNIEKCIDKPSEFCNAIAQIPLKITIYDDYIE